jgi:hypothetical protein
MALEDLFEDSLPGLVIGAVAAAVLMPLLGARRLAAGAAAGAAGGATQNGVGRPLMKAAVKGYLSVADRIKEVAAEAREQMSDLVAEVREESKLRDQQAATGAETAAS